jgi:SAM-dependent methyltransferase
MGSSVPDLQARFYPEKLSRDAVAIFMRDLEAQLKSTDVVLDIGAGAGALNPYQFKGRVASVIGVDVDPRVTDNPLLDRGIVGDGQTIPLPDASVDLAFSIYVQEHVAKPQEFAREIFRILAPGGRYLALTPNRFHYVPLVASVTPTSFHRSVNERRGRLGEDTFPTCYRLNTPGAIERHFKAAGFQHVSTRGIEVEPQYLKFSKATYLCGVLYERLVNSTEKLTALRVNIIAQCAK